MTQSSKYRICLRILVVRLTNSTKTSRTPRYMPGGEVCSRDLRVSGAIAAIQLATPAIEPAANILSGLMSSRLYVEYKPVDRCTNQNNKHRVPSALGSDFPQHPLIATKIERTARHIYTHVCHTLQYTHGQLETIPMQKLTGICEQYNPFIQNGTLPLSRVAIVPLYRLRMPPSRKSCLPQSMELVYLGAPSLCIWICTRHTDGLEMNR